MVLSSLRRFCLLTVGLLVATVPVVVSSQRAVAAPVCDTTPAALPTADVLGTFHGIVPQRVADSRRALAISERLVPGCSVAVDIGSSAAVPAQARAVSLNVTASDSARPGYLVVYPCGTPIPPTSNVNSEVGNAVPNLVIVPLPASSLHLILCCGVKQIP